MNWFDTFRTGLSAVKANRLRSALTVLGIMIGIAENRAPLLEAPAGTGSGEQTLGGGLTAAEKHEAGQQNWPEEKAGQMTFE